jgi:hypothetical protein
MNFTKEQMAEMGAWMRSRAYQVWQIKLAQINSDTLSENHPDNIRRRIKEDAALLREALSA